MNKNTRLAIFLPIAFALVLASGIIIGAKIYKGNSRVFTNNSGGTDKIGNLINYIEENYVDTINHEKLVSQTIDAMLQTLDPHSSYIPAEEFKTANESLEGSFEGVGVEFSIQRDTIMVVNAVPGGPSSKLGITAGDRIVKIDGKNVAGIKIANKDVFKRLRGKKGTKVQVSIIRFGNKKPIEFTITRDNIPTKSIDSYFMVNKDVGYIKLSKFSQTSYDEFMEGSESLLKRGMKKMIFDLRGNGGGLLDVATDICNEFLDKGKLIVYTEGRVRARKEYHATRKGSLRDIKLVVLIDESSASASEIVTGAIQDNDRGTVVGRRSFGKGLVQEQVKLPDGSAVRLTVSRYYTPTGRCIQKSYKDGVGEYYNEFSKRFSDGELENADSIHLNKTQKFKTPKGKVVYGGGGIMPDIFLPLDTAGMSAYLGKLNSHGLVNQFVFNYADKNRAAIKNMYKTYEQFESGFTVTPQMIQEIVAMGEAKGVKLDKIGLAKSEKIMKAQAKAYIGRSIYGDNAFYPIILKIDDTYLKAINIINKM